MKKKNNSKAAQFFQDHPLALHLLVMMGVSVVALIIILWSLDLFTRHGSEEQMPDLLGMTIDEAQESSGLDFEFVVTDSIYVDTLSGGQIAIQDPKQGSMVKSGRKVYVTLAKYVENDVRMPQVINRPLKQAMGALEGAGLQCGSLTFVHSYNEVHNLSSEVLNAYHSGRRLLKGDKLPAGSKVDFEVSIDTTYVPKVPNLIGLGPAEARKSLHSRCLNIGEEHFDGVSDRRNARVWRQDPEFSKMRSFQHGAPVSVWYREMSASEVESLRAAAESNAQAEVSDSQTLDDVMTSAVMSEFEF